ncbi:MAG: hypothetical protein KJZ77_10270 [Anaerolineales bacterium]|nr:hypothetical protein [Anaerolineales bacterium]
MKRPFPETLTLWVVLMLTMWNAVRAWTSLAWSGILTEFSARIAPAVSAGIGVFWAVAGAILLWGIWQKKAWAGKMLLGTAAGYTVWYWGERLFLQNPRPNAWFAVIVNLGVMTIILLAVRSISREAYERTIENPKTE